MSIATEIADQALSIPASERLNLAAILIASVSASARPSLSEEEAIELALSRAEEIDTGRVQSLSFKSEMEKIRGKLAG